MTDLYRELAETSFAPETLDAPARLIAIELVDHLDPSRARDVRAWLDGRGPGPAAAQALRGFLATRPPVAARPALRRVRDAMRLVADAPPPAPSFLGDMTWHRLLLRFSQDLEQIATSPRGAAGRRAGDFLLRHFFDLGA